jgi:hypothetical protein
MNSRYTKEWSSSQSACVTAVGSGRISVLRLSLRHGRQILGVRDHHAIFDSD